MQTLAAFDRLCSSHSLALEIERETLADASEPGFGVGAYHRPLIRHGLASSRHGTIDL